MSLISRACLACYGLGALFTALSGRLIYLAVTQHEYYADKATGNYSTTIPLTARRGAILDTDGNYLARNEMHRTVILDGSLITEKQRGPVANLLAGPLGMKPEEILAKIHPKKYYVVLKKKVSEDVAVGIGRAIGQIPEKDRPKGIMFEQGFDRVYPSGQMLCHVVGFCGMGAPTANNPRGSFNGVEGVERSMETWLAGQDGWRHYEKDAFGSELVNHGGEQRSPSHGNNVRLTVSLNLQQIVEDELEAACKRLRPLRACVVMMNPETGDILALANRPTFDPNTPSKVSPEEMPRRKMTEAEAKAEENRIASTRRFNYTIAGTYEPGSTFKVVTCAAALNSRMVTQNTEIWCENGKWHYARKSLSDHHPYGMLSVSQIIEKSSNIGAAKLAVQLGKDRFSSYIGAFGFGQISGIALTGEQPGIIRDKSKWTDISITRIAMGHEVTATPLQVTAATCAIANGGRLLMPRLVRDISDDEGKILVSYEPLEIRRVITEATALKVRDALVKVTGKKGTASRAHIPGFQVAGKTGTAQKVVDGHYSHEHHITSFVGFVPAEKPAFCMLVLFDQARLPANEDVGGLVAAPVFRTIAERALAHLGIEPDPALLEKEDLVLAKSERH